MKYSQLLFIWGVGRRSKNVRNHGLPSVDNITVNIIIIFTLMSLTYLTHKHIYAWLYKQSF